MSSLRIYIFFVSYILYCDALLMVWHFSIFLAEDTRERNGTGLFSGPEERNGTERRNGCHP